MFKVGDKIICIDNLQNGRSFLGLTYGKQYENIKFMGKKDYNWKQKWVHIINDRNESQNYLACRFVSISEFRKIKINKIQNHG